MPREIRTSSPGRHTRVTSMTAGTDGRDSGLAFSFAVTDVAQPGTRTLRVIGPVPASTAIVVAGPSGMLVSRRNVRPSPWTRGGVKGLTRRAPAGSLV